MKRYLIVEIETGSASMKKSTETVKMAIEDFARIEEGDVPYGFGLKIKEIDKPRQKTFKKLSEVR
jgi:hypothetical protein